MNERLYYNDSKLITFEAKIIERRQSERGPAVRLKQTAFYPTSGGQPYDTGTINEIPVLEVWEDENGQVWHLLSKPLSGETASGQVDWERRFDHMQQHSGQHLLSAAFVHLFNAATTSFHLGSSESTIDLDIQHLTWQDALKVEKEVNRVIWENRPVQVHIVNQENIASIPLRKPPQVSGKIRIIWVPDYDASACGGTHVSSTGEVGLLKITNISHYKGGVRLSFLCGERARSDYQRVLSGLQTASAGLSVHQDELGEAIIRLQEENKELHSTLKKVQGELIGFKAEKLWQETPEEEGGLRRIFAHWDHGSFEEVRLLAASLVERRRTLALLAVSETKGLRLVCARSQDLPDLDAAAILSAAAQELGGRGGGSPEMAQGGAQNQLHETVIAALRGAVKKVEPANSR